QTAAAKKMSEILSADQSNPVEVKRVEFVGPQVGDELRDQSGIALIVALFGILVYVVLRFDFKFAVGAIVALIHDVVITLGVFSFWQIPFDLTVLAAVLALIGYSINDTIVVFDRIRENFRLMRKSEPVEVFNFALTSTLGRTTITSGVTQLVVVALFFFGGEVIHGFALALLIGITVGTYSSIFIASALSLILGVTKEHFIVEKKEELVDDRP
ncbi:MAG TPA: protein translocase subunit SecF, partial [Pseudomonadales bacterium]|nr:protein translocase subunit SecF [Pseudomonadales bacterium]